MRIVTSASVAVIAATLMAAPAAAADKAAGQKHPHMMNMGKPPELATTKPTRAGHYRATLLPRKTPVAINVMHAWVLTLKTPDGKPVEGAVIAVDGGMPMHGHGLPTAPRVTRYLGGGKYLVEGMKFSMTGWWQLKFAIAKPKPDTVTFNVMVK